jgi:hypothetical protein
MKRKTFKKELFSVNKNNPYQQSKKADLSYRLVWWIILLALLLWVTFWYAGLRSKIIEILNSIF